MRSGNLTFNKTGCFINIFTGIFATLALFGFVMFASGCKDKTEIPKNESPVAGNIAVSKSKEIKQSKATGKDTYSIEEIYSQKKDLSKKTVTVHAKVVKFLPGIMGKNWIHIQDGTGSAETETHDITVSTLDTAEVGDEVIVHGTLEINKNLGSMHFFAVIIEDASLAKVQ